MRRALLAFFGLAVITWFSFSIYPGHTYLASSSQAYVAILQRLAAPGFLTRDLVATHPNVTYTAYDEITLALKQFGRLNFASALAFQQILCRLAGSLGFFLIARSSGLRPWGSLAVSALVNAGTYLGGADLRVIDTEPVPNAFALGFALLGIGCFARGRMLLAAFFGGIALIYSPVIAAPFWITLLIVFTFDRQLRRYLRPALPILLIFVLLLANLAQLQPAIGVESPSLGTLPEIARHVEQIRLPELWVSLWDRKWIHLYLALFVIGGCAVTRVWPILNRPMKWIFILIPTLGALSIPLSWIMLDRLHQTIIPRLQPLDSLLMAVAFVWLACALAGFRSLRNTRHLEPIGWFAFCALLLAAGLFHARRTSPDHDTRELADWAENRTWGSSVFLFPDAGRATRPGAFRALSRRALWVDWQSGTIMKAYPQLASEWWLRWKRTAATLPSEEQLQFILTLPIDYYVLDRTHRFQAEDRGRFLELPAVHVNNSYVVYDAGDLRNVSGKVSLVNSRSPHP